MSKKTLLNESTVRQFMKFAKLGALSDNFINENYVEEDVNEEVVEEGGEEPLEEVAPLVAATLAGGAAGAMMDEDEPEIAPMDDDMPADDVEMADDAPSEELPPEAVDALEHAVEAAADAMLAALAPFGVEGEASVEDDAPPVDLDAEAPPMGDEAPPMGDEAPPVDGEEEVLDEVEMIDEEEIVQETMKRVMNRLKLMKETKEAEEKKDKMIDSVADAIVARLRAKK